MAKVKRSKKVSRIKKIASAKVDNKLSILLIVLALLVSALAAISMGQSGYQTSSSNQAKVTVSPTPKPAVKTTK
jgi:hypothetical protein